jgi:carbamoyl-phosphate synthase large subunit
MKSTGEVMGTAATFARAYDKAQDATGKPIPRSGTAVIDLEDEEFPEPDSHAGRSLRAGFAEFFDLVDGADKAAFEEAIKAGEVDLIVSRSREPLTVAVEEVVTYFSTYPSAKAALAAIHSKDEPLDVQALSERTKRDEFWGQPKWAP